MVFKFKKMYFPCSTQERIIACLFTCLLSTVEISGRWRQQGNFRRPVMRAAQRTSASATSHTPGHRRRKAGGGATPR